MKIIDAKNYDEMSELGANILIETIEKKKDASICLATGGSPKKLYENFVNEINERKLDISNVTFVKLDEWYDVEETQPFTCTTFIKENILDKLHMKPKAFLSLPTKCEDPNAACAKLQAYLDQNPIDVMILGLGMNGHLGLNEPNTHLNLHTHQANLSDITKTHDMAQGKPLTSGLTIGLKSIFEAKQVLMLVCGNKKEDAYQQFMSQKISTLTPASLLWLHPNCTSIIDRNKFSI